MRRRGFTVTQASISRDFRKLGVVKAGGRYVIAEHTVSPQASLVGKMIISSSAVGENLVVIRTKPGCANAVAQVLDNVTLEGLVGTVAGDDTIFAAVESRLAGKHLLSAISSL